MYTYEARWRSDSPERPASGARMADHRRAAARRQDELLDQALLETFPASDPVSVARIT